MEQLVIDEEPPPPSERKYSFITSMLNYPHEKRYGSLMDPLEDEVDPEDCAEGGESIRNAMTIGVLGEILCSLEAEPVYSWERKALPVPAGEAGSRYDPEEKPKQEIHRDILKFSRFVLTNWSK